jgi:hypothetical protein
LICREAAMTRQAFLKNFIGGIRAPALKISVFQFTSATEF